MKKQRSPDATKLTCGVMLALLASGCSPMPRPDQDGNRGDPDEAFGIQTDSTEYQLRQHEGGSYSVNLEGRVVNRLDQTVFLHRDCGFGDRPSSSLRRVGGDTTSIWLNSGGACITRPLREPIPLGSGETYVDQVELFSTASRYANPPITMEMRTGNFVLIYDIQLTNAVEGWEPVDPLPTELTASNPFVVHAPE